MLKNNILPSAQHGQFEASKVKDTPPGKNYLLLSVNRHLSLDRPWISPSNLQQWSATSHEKTLKVNNRLLVVPRCASSKKYNTRNYII